MKNTEQQFTEDLALTTSRHETQSLNSVRELSNSSIPDDLLVQIFSRLPLKSIARFSCLSKFLASILRRHDFTDLFLTKSLTRPRLLFTIKANGKLFFYSAPQPHNPDDNSSLVATPFPSSFPEYFPCDICSTVCGLVLLQGYRNRKVRVICNTATGEFLTLPKVLLKEKNLPNVEAESNRTEVAGMYFGYDPVGKQLKVLCMTSSRDERPNTHQVLTLESGKRVWRTVKHRFHFVVNYRTSGDKCIDGVLYFGGSFGLSSRIVCFDIRSEKFCFINMHEGMQLVGSILLGALTLFNYKGKLGIHQCDKDNLFREKELVLWVLEDAGNHKWSKHSYVLSSLGSEIVPYNRFVGMTSTGEVVWKPYHKRSNPFYIFFYSLESKSFKRVYIQGLEEFGDHNYIILGIFLDYVENMKFM